MPKAYWFAGAALAVLMLAGAGGWTMVPSLAGASRAVGGSVQIDPMEAMKNAKTLPTPHYDDYSVVFN